MSIMIRESNLPIEIVPGTYAPRTKVGTLGFEMTRDQQTLFNYAIRQQHAQQQQNQKQLYRPRDFHLKTIVTSSMDSSGLPWTASISKNDRGDFFYTGASRETYKISFETAERRRPRIQQVET